jgi:hypothetical protein
VAILRTNDSASKPIRRYGRPDTAVFRSANGAISTRCHTDRRFEPTRESTLVREPARHADFRNTHGPGQVPHSRLNPDFCQHLAGRQLKDSTEMALELRDRAADALGKVGHAKAVSVPGLHQGHDALKSVIGMVTAVGCAQILGDTDEAAYTALEVKRLLGRQAPPGGAVRKHVEFKLPLYRVSAKHPLVLFGINTGQRRWEERTNILSDEIAAVRETQATHQRPVRMGVSPGVVFDEENDIRQGVEQRLQLVCVDIEWHILPLGNELIQTPLKVRGSLSSQVAVHGHPSRCKSSSEDKTRKR